MFPTVIVKTRYRANSKGAGRIKVITPQGTKSIPYDHAAKDAHAEAIKAVYGDGAVVEYKDSSKNGATLTHAWAVFA